MQDTMSRSHVHLVELGVDNVDVFVVLHQLNHQRAVSHRQKLRVLLQR